MTKFRKSILIFGILVLIIGAALGTFIVLSLTGSLRTEAIELEFTVDYAEKEYDGTPLTASSYKITAGFPIEGHTPVVTFTGEQTEVGDGLSGLEVKMVNESGYDVTREYDIRVVPGVLSVYQCPLRVALTAHDVHYDGAMVDIGDGYTVTGGKLVKGHRIMLQIKDEWFAVAGTTIAGETLTAGDFDLYILDANGRNVTSNYSVAPPTGRVNIIQRPLVITPESVEKIYDGKPLTCSRYIIETGTLASGQYIVAEFRGANGGSAQVTDANEDSPLEVVVAATIYDINGSDVTANYDIRPNIGYITVKKANLSIVAKSKSWEYDGEEHSFSDDPEAESVTGLADGDDVIIECTGSVTDVSVVTNKIEKYYINGGEINNNYKVTLKDGKLEVTQAPLTVTLKSLNKKYGDSFEDDFDDLYTIKSTRTDLKLEFATETYLEDLFKNIKGIGLTTYTLSDFKVKREDKDDDITKMFSISVSAGNINIEPRELELNVFGLSKTYDGNLIFTENLPQIDELVNDDKLDSITCAYSNGVYTIKSVSLVDAQGNGVNGCYSITNFGDEVAVTISQRDVKITAKGLEKTYDGTPLRGDNVTYDSLAEGDRLVYTPAQITYVSESGTQNEPEELTIYNKNGEDVTNLYNLITDYGTLKITKRQLSITLSPVYGNPTNGMDLTGIINISGLAGGDVVYYPEPFSVVWVNGNMVGVSVDYIQVRRNGTDVTDNYDFPTEEITGTVIPS